MGWIYVITCDMYDNENIKKIGYTDKIGILEEDVRTSLLQRYATTLICPRILQLIKVSNPRKAEKKTFEILKKFRFDKEIFKVDISEVQSALQVIKKDVDDSKDKIDTVVNNLMDYNDTGRKYMYTENK